MKLILDDVVGRFRNFFTEMKTNGPEVATKKISPSGLACQVAVAYKLTGVEMLPEYRSFESDGYASSGSARHQTIQEFLQKCPGVEWVNIEQYIKENNLPFDVDYEWGIRDKAEKYGLTCEQVCELVGSHERLLRHHNGLIQFKLDGLIKFEGEYYIVEIKTCSDADSKKAPLQKHQLQGKSYSLLLKIPKIIWIYESRENFKHVIAFQEIQPDEIEEIRSYLNNIVKFKNDPTKLSRSMDCKFCRYREHCEKVFANVASKTVF